MKKRVLLSICFFLTGCTSSEQTRNTQVEIECTVLTYMEEKYQQKFEIYEVERPWLSDTVLLWMRSLEDPLQQLFLVEWDTDAEVLIKETYSKYVYTYDLEVVVTSLLDTTFSECFSYAGFDTVLSEFVYHKNYTIAEVMKNYPTEIYVIVYVAENESYDIEHLQAKVHESYQQLQALCHVQTTCVFYIRVCEQAAYQKSKAIWNTAKESGWTAEKRRKEIQIWLSTDRVLKSYTVDKKHGVFYEIENK